MYKIEERTTAGIAFKPQTYWALTDGASDVNVSFDKERIGWLERMRTGRLRTGEKGLYTKKKRKRSKST